MRILLISTAALLILPVVLLHAASFLFSLHDRAMNLYTSEAGVDLGGHRLRWFVLRQSQAEYNIVFIHGTPATAAVFGEQFKHPFPRAELAALDRPGFGASGLGRRIPSLEENAEAVGFLLGKLPRRKTILVGHSYGGPVALLAGLKFTNQVAGVLLIGGSVDPDQEQIFAIQRFADWPVVSWLVPKSLRQCNRELMSLRGDLLRLREQIPKLTVPVLMLHGGKDRQVPVANVDYLRAQLTAAGNSNLFEQLVFPNYNHFIPWEHPDAVEAALEKLAQRIGRESKEHGN